jgi:hypothetical protein
MFNLPATGETLSSMDGWDPEVAIRLIKMQDRKFSPAYRIKVAKGDKVEQAVKVVDDFYCERAVHLKNLTDSPSCESAHKYLQTIRWIGPFSGYQMLVDLVDTPILSDKPDTQTWAHAGPGAVRGVNRLNMRDVNFTSNTHDFLSEILELKDQLSGTIWEKLSAMDIQHNLCEFDKYHRVLEGGRMKRRYRK